MRKNRLGICIACYNDILTYTIKRDDNNIIYVKNLEYTLNPK